MANQSDMNVRSDREVVPITLVIAIQVVAVVYFLFDAVREEAGVPAVLDIVVGVALFAGIALGALAIRRLHAERRQQEAALAVARGALGDLMRQRFAEWKLSRSEADVALFALKGCAIADIAQMRGSSAGTVRSQLSQVYAKAGVSGQPMLMSLFLEDLLGPAGPLPG